MSIGNGLQGLTCRVASVWNLLGLRACLQFGQSPCNHNQECHVHLPFHQHALSLDQSLILPACDLRTLSLTYIHKVHYTQYLSRTLLFSMTRIIQVSPSVLPFKVLLKISGELCTFGCKHEIWPTDSSHQYSIFT